MKRIVPYLLSFSFLLFISWKIGAYAHIHLIKCFSDLNLLAAVFLSVFFYNFAAPLKVRMISRYSGVDVAYWSVIRYQGVSYLLKYILPLKLGEFAKVFVFARVAFCDFQKAISILLYDKITAFFPLIVCLLISLLNNNVLKQNNINLSNAFYSMFYAVLIFVLLHLIGKHALKNNRKHKEYFRTFSDITGTQNIKIFILSGFIQTIDYLIVFFAFNMFGIEMPFFTFASTMTLVIIGSSVPFAVAGIGVRESLFVLLFRPYAERHILFTAGLLLSFIGHVVPALFGLFFIKDLPDYVPSEYLKRIKTIFAKTEVFAGTEKI